MKKINIYQYSAGRISYRILMKKINSHRERLYSFLISLPWKLYFEADVARGKKKYRTKWFFR